MSKPVASTVIEAENLEKRARRVRELRQAHAKLCEALDLLERAAAAAHGWGAPQEASEVYSHALLVRQTLSRNLSSGEDSKAGLELTIAQLTRKLKADGGAL